MTDAPSRLPPGQTLTAKWPVLTYGDTPRVDTGRRGRVEPTMQQARAQRARE